MSALQPTAALDLMKAVMRAGRNHGPALMFDWWYGGKLTVSELRAIIGDVWIMAEWPAACLGRAEWVSLFRTVGFVSDTDERSQPTGPLIVYRGASWGHRRGMSWTEDRERATWFAHRWTAGAGLVFETTVEPATVLARLGDPDGRDESEVVVDPAMLPPIRRPPADNLRTAEGP